MPRKSQSTIKTIPQIALKMVQDIQEGLLKLIDATDQKSFQNEVLCPVGRAYSGPYNDNKKGLIDFNSDLTPEQADQLASSLEMLAKKIRDQRPIYQETPILDDPMNIPDFQDIVESNRRDHE